MRYLKIVSILFSLSLLVPMYAAAQWYEAMRDQPAIDHKIDVANQLGMAGLHTEAVDTLLSILLKYEIPAQSRLAGELHLMIGAELMFAKAYPLSLSHFLLAAQSDAKLTRKKHRDLVTILAGVYVKLEDWPNASACYHQILQEERQGKDSTAVSPAQNNLGIFHLEKGALDSAEWYFIQAESSFQRHPFRDTVFMGSVRDNLARVYKQNSAYSLALALYQRNVLTYANKSPQKDHSLMQALNGVAEMQLKLGHPDKALPLLLRAKGLLRRANPKFQEELEAEWLRLRLLQARAVGDWATFDEFAARQTVFQDSLLRQIEYDLNRLNAAQAGLVEREFNKEKEIQQLQIQREKAKIDLLQVRARNFWIGGILVAICLALGGSLYFRSLRFRAESLRKQLEINSAKNQLVEERLAQEKLAKENLELKVSLKQQDLTNFALDNQRKRELLAHLGKQLKKLKPGQVTQAKISVLINDMMLQAQTESISRHYEENIDIVNAEFRANLLQRFPKLSPLELELCGMIRLGMQVKEIAAFRNVTENAILVSRKRLRKKLEIETGKDLRVFLLEE